MHTDSGASERPAENPSRTRNGQGAGNLAQRGSRGHHIIYNKNRFILYLFLVAAHKRAGHVTSALLSH